SGPRRLSWRQADLSALQCQRVSGGNSLKNIDKRAENHARQIALATQAEIVQISPPLCLRLIYAENALWLPASLTLQDLDLRLHARFMSAVRKSVSLLGLLPWASWKRCCGASSMKIETERRATWRRKICFSLKSSIRLMLP